MRRAGVSIPANIAEGYGRGHRADYIRFLDIARGSLHEVRTYLDLCHKLGYASEEQLNRAQQLAEEISRMLSGLIRSLKTNRQP
jgi:four helix bundle protein